MLLADRVASSLQAEDHVQLNRVDDLSSLRLILILRQQASIPKFSQLLQLDGGIAPSLRSHWGSRTSQSIELHGLLLCLTNRVVAVQWDSMDGAIGKDDRCVGLSLCGQSGKLRQR
jgi:hypothetical protein